VTQQNAALVEEAAAAADSLQEQAKALADIVAAFKLHASYIVEAARSGPRSLNPPPQAGDGEIAGVRHLHPARKTSGGVQDQTTEPCADPR